MTCTKCPVGKFQNLVGEFYCDEVRKDALLQAVTNPTTGEIEMIEKSCPKGMLCVGGKRTYEGSVWHNPAIKYPVQRNMYVCVNDGCPDKGSSEMVCKQGYHGPLCAICSPGYYEQLGHCNECKEPHIAALALFILGVMAMLALIAMAIHRNHRIMTGEMAANVKVMTFIILYLMWLLTPSAPHLR